MAKMEKCVVCAYTFKGDEEVTKDGNLVCPYCGTIKAAFNGHEDFARTKLITDGYAYLRESNMQEASKCFINYSSEYGSEDSELILGQALLECKLSNCMGSKLGKLVTVVHQESLKDVVLKESFTNVIKMQNPTIYQNVMDLYEKEREENIKANAVIIVSPNLGKLDLYEGMLSDFSNVCRADFLDDGIESIIYPNVKSSKALVVYVDSIELLRNAYFLSIYYRMKALKKNVVLLHDGIRIPEMYSEDVKIKTDDPLLKEKLLQGINRAYGASIEKKQQGFIMEATDVKSIVGKIVSLPTNAQSIAPRAAFQSEIQKLIISSTGEFMVGERAFAESSLETFDVQSKNCDITIKKDAFSDCKALKSVVFSNEKISLENNCFRGCTSLRSINLSMFSDLIIPDHAFDGAKSLYEIKLKGVKKIAKYAFRDTSLEEIELTTATVLEPKAFSDCKDLKRVKVYSDKEMVLEIDDTTFNEGVTISFIGKDSKKCFKQTKKNTKKTYKLEFLKSE